MAEHSDEKGWGERRWTDGYWQSPDGLKLHYRDYVPKDGGSAARPPILCLPGLTRNAADFAHLADRLADEWRVVCVEFRGRGDSENARDPATYQPVRYMIDMEALIAELGLSRFVLVGTSLGGIVSALLAHGDPVRVAGAVLNDVGPVLEETGLERIRQHVGQGGSQPTWVHAARALAEVHGSIYPDYALQDWIDMAKRLCRLNSKGRIVLAYDARIAEPFRAPPDPNAPDVDMWPFFEALSGVPTLIVRGARSDILSAATAKAMVKRIAGAELVTVPRVGHAPTLDEPQAAAAIDALLRRIGAG